jgi:uncharacterized protein (UPF0276 family)
LRKEHFLEILDRRPPVDWFEALTENYLVPGGKPRHYLGQVRELYPLVLHGVSLNLGGSSPLDPAYLSQLKDLVRWIRPAWISDHLCWTGLDGFNTHDLLPLPYTEETVRHVATRVTQVQDLLGERILVENVSSYLTWRSSRLTEWEFVAAVAETADCLILLDLNNIQVNAVNHGFDPLAYLDGIPMERVQQIHLAGHRDYGDHLIDSHDTPVAAPVWELLAAALRRCGPVATMIERDDHIPPLEELLLELDQARAIAARVGAHG